MKRILSILILIAAMSTASATVLYSENFDDGIADNWTVVSGTWDATSGYYKYTGTQIHVDTYYNQTNFSNFQYDVKLKVAAGNGAGVTFRYVDSANNYWVFFDGGDNEIKLYKKVSGSYTLLNNTTQTITVGNYYNAIIIADGSNIKIYVDGVLKIDHTDATYTEGKIGLHPYATEAHYDDITVSSTGNPTITSYAPTGTIYPEVGDDKTFNVTVNESTQCNWYINGSRVHTNSSLSTTHAYTNTSLLGGGCNVTAVVNNTGNDSQTWIFEVGADSISYVILQDTPTNQSMIFEVNLTRVGSNVTDVGWWQNHTFDGWNYTLRYTNGTAIKSLTASGDNDTLWFNGTTLLQTGVYFINATDTSTGIETFVNPSFVSAGAAAILFVAAAGRFAINAWRNRRRKRRN